MKKFLFFTLFYSLLPVFAFAQLSLYKGGQNKFISNWVYPLPPNATVMTTGQNMPYEGTEHYQLSYNVTSYYAGYGFRLNPIDFSGYTHLRIAHRGLNAGQYAAIKLRTPPDQPGTFSEAVKLLPSTTYEVTEIPLSKFLSCGTFNLRNVSEFIVEISGVQVSSGNFYIDAIELINKPPTALDDDPTPSVSASAKTWNRAKTLGYGVNIDIKTEIPSLGYDPFRLWTEQEIINLARMNVKTIRCATTIEYFMNTTPPYTINFNSRQGRLLDSMVTWAVRHNINLIIDNHVGIETDPSNAYWREATYLEDIRRTSALWKQLTLRYIDKNADKIFFEIKNEPGISGDNLLSNRTLRKINHAVIDTIRRYDKERTLVVTTSGYSPVDSLIVSRPYNDDNLIYTFHSYEPGDFTYQGFTWFVNYNIDIPFPKTNDIALLTCLYTRAKQWSLDNNVPIFNGEFGVSGRSDPTSRCNYMKTSGQLMDSLSIPAMYYSPESYYYGFGFFKGEVIKDSMAIPCFADALHFTRPNITPPTSKVLYKGGQTEITGAWVKDGTATIVETNTDSPFEGGQHYEMNYTSTTVYNGGGLNFHNWWGYTKPPLDFTDGNYTHLRLSYKGLTAGQTLRAQIFYKYLRREVGNVLTEQGKGGVLVDVGTYSADYKTVDIPIQSLINPNSTNAADLKGLWFVSGISFFLSDPTMAGTVYIDGIELVNKNIVANVPPSVNITAPANNATFTAPASVTISANATDTDGTISKVEFYTGATLLNTDNTAPYSFAWTNVAAGTYTLTAKAYDNLNAVSTSSPVMIVVNTSTVPICLQDDYAELQKLYTATNGVNWTNKTNWFTNVDMATWFGITLTADGCDIKNINLPTNNLTGTLPALTLGQLEIFNVSDNKITGVIPPLSMPKLTALYLYTNQLTGTIPTFTMPNLTGLWLSTNQLTGSIPDFNLPNLVDLRLRFCQFTGNVPTFTNTKLNTANALIWLTGNKLVFGNLENRTWLTTAADVAYAPQQGIKLSQNVNVLSVSTGSADNMQMFDWYKDGVLLTTNQNSSYQATMSGRYFCRVKHNTLTVAGNVNKNLILQSDTLDIVVSAMTTPTLKIKDAQAAINSTVRIPITLTKNLNPLKGFQLFFKANNPNIVTFTGITPKKFANPPFTIVVDTSRNTFGEMGVIGFTLGDCSTTFVEGDTLFTIDARIRGTIGQQDSINFLGANKLVLCDGATAMVDFQGGKVNIMNTTYKISGTATQPIARKPLNKARINASNSGQVVSTMETDAMGIYSMDVTNTNTIVVKPTKTGLVTGKIDIDDISSIVDIILNTNQNPYQRIAADWNCDNSIDISDILDVIDYIFRQKPAARCTNDWYFVPTTTTLTGNYPYNYTSEVSFPTLMENKTVSYWGMMRGDVNGNVATNFTTPLHASVRGASNIELSAPNKIIEIGKTYQIPIRVKNFKTIKNFQGVINYDKDVFTLQSVTKNTVLAQQIFGVNQDSIGRIALLWANFGQGGISLADKDTMLTLTVLAKKSMTNLSGRLLLDTTASTLLPPKGANTLGDSLKLSFALDFTSPTTEGVQNMDYFNVFPNPSSHSVTIEAQFKKPETVDFMVLNGIGQVVVKRTLNAGQVKEVLDVSAFAEGVYQVILQTASGRIARRMTIIK